MCGWTCVWTRTWVIGGGRDVVRSDELKRLTAWMWKYRPDLAKLPWQGEAQELETMLALAAWRSRKFDDRALALVDALVLDPPVWVSELGATRRGWATGEDVASVDEWGHAGEGT